MNDNYRVFDRRMSLAESLFSNVVLMSMLAFCIYISQGSTWWTFITGSLFLFVVFLRVAHIAKLKTNEFNSKADLMKWVESLPDDKEKENK